MRQLAFNTGSVSFPAIRCLGLPFTETCRGFGTAVLTRGGSLFLRGVPAGPVVAVVIVLHETAPPFGVVVPDFNMGVFICRISVPQRLHVSVISRHLLWSGWMRDWYVILPGGIPVGSVFALAENVSSLYQRLFYTPWSVMVLVFGREPPPVRRVGCGFRMTGRTRS